MKFDVAVFGGAFHDTYLTSGNFQTKKTSNGLLMCEMLGAKIAIDNSVITTGGGATNASVCLERLGLQTAIIACVGHDPWGKMVREKLEEEGVSLLYLQKEKKENTSSSVILVGKNGERTALVYRAASDLLSAGKVDWNRLNANFCYVSSLGGDFQLLQRIVKFSQDKESKIAINPGSSELKEKDKLQKLLKHFHILILNKQEALQLTGEKKIETQWFYNCGAEMTLITNGDKGAIVFTKNGKTYKQAALSVKAIEVTGAGDSFGSSFLAGIAQGFDIPKSLKMAAINSASVVKHIGPKEGLLFLPEIKSKL